MGYFSIFKFPCLRKDPGSNPGSAAQPFNKYKNMLNSVELIAKRKSILDAFTKAKNELVTLNTEVEASIKENNKQLAALIKENEALTNVKSSNMTSIKALSKLLG